MSTPCQVNQLFPAVNVICFGDLNHGNKSVEPICNTFHVCAWPGYFYNHWDFIEVHEQGQISFLNSLDEGTRNNSQKTAS